MTDLVFLDDKKSMENWAVGGKNDCGHTNISLICMIKIV